MAKMTLDKLAVMIKNGFDASATKSDLVGINKRLSNLENGQSILVERVTSLERGQEDILLRLDNVAYRFEVVDLKKRVTKTEGRLNTIEAEKNKKSST